MHALSIGVCIFATALLLGGCSREPEPFGVEIPAVQPLPASPATGMHYAQTAWPTLHRDSSNSDYVPFDVSTRLRHAWGALDGAALLVGPVIGPEGHLYVPSGRGRGSSHLHAFSPEGDLLWQSPPMDSPADFDHGAVISAPIIDDAGNVFAADSNQLWSFTADGALRWTADLPAVGVHGFFVTPVFSQEGFVGGISTDGKLALFHRNDGTLAIPVLDLPGVAGPPSQDPPPGIWEGGMVAPEFVRPLWDVLNGRAVEVANTPAVHPVTGRIFITAGGATMNEGVLYGIDTTPDGARIAFATAMGAGSGTSPAISPDGRLVYAIDDAGVMVAVDTTSGDVIWQASDTMGQASPTIGPDGTIYSFNGIKGTVVAIDGSNGSVKWRRQYDAIAREHLPWRPLLKRSTTVDSIITVADNGLLLCLDLNYLLPFGDDPFPQPRKFVLAHLDLRDGTLLGWTETRDASSALVVPDSDGSVYISQGGIISSITHHGVDPRLPRLLRADRRPTGGLQALKPLEARD